ncbi:MAG TPA: hypothetical protein VMU51_26515 [Mycobacteriales bacterium]|nr:hypothetical protein [Mycobacteriales bacterium]
MSTLSKFQSRSARDRVPATGAGDPELVAGGRPAPVCAAHACGGAGPADPGPQCWSGMFAAAGAPCGPPATWSVARAAA